jgi:hypothetical protein
VQTLKFFFLEVSDVLAQYSMLPAHVKLKIEKEFPIYLFDFFRYTREQVKKLKNRASTQHCWT